MIHPTAVVASGAKLADDVTVEAFSVIHDGVTVGAGSYVGSHCVIGYSERPQESRKLQIGSGARIRSHTVLYAGSSIGPSLETGHHVTIREDTTIGKNLRVGTQTDLQGHSSFGDYVRIHSNVFVAQQAQFDDFVWVFPHVVFTDDPHPPSDGHHAGPKVGAFASLGARALVLPGVTIGKDSFVAAGSLVTADVRPGAVVVGSPARDKGDATSIQLTSGGPAYPWRNHFVRGYPAEVVAGWGTLDSSTDP